LRSEDILDQVAAEMKASPYFALQLDKSTDVVSCAQSLVYDRYLNADREREIYVL
jgi:hypothetical protein